MFDCFLIPKICALPWSESRLKCPGEISDILQGNSRKAAKNGHLSLDSEEMTRASASFILLSVLKKMLQWWAVCLHSWFLNIGLFCLPKAMCCSFLFLVLLLGHLLSEFAEESLRLQEILCCPSLNIFKHIHLRAKVTGAKFRDREAWSQIPWQMYWKFFHAD